MASGVLSALVLDRGAVQKAGGSRPHGRKLPPAAWLAVVLLTAGTPGTGWATDGAFEGSQALGREEAELQRRAWTPGTTFRDCEGCPEMVVVPSGSFLMGSPSSEWEGNDNERPVHRVTFERPFAVGVYEVTFEEWEECLSAGGCDGYRRRDHGWGRGSRPVINVSWEEAKGYVAWLSGETGESYRLLSESEWEYVARAGRSGLYHHGSSISLSQANYGWREGRTVPVGSYSPNAQRLYDVHGNVSEWVEDCWNDSYRGAPTDGSAWEAGDCSRRVKRGGSWMAFPAFLRLADRTWSSDIGNPRTIFTGFRVARTLN